MSVWGETFFENYCYFRIWIVLIAHLFVNKVVNIVAWKNWVVQCTQCKKNGVKMRFLIIIVWWWCLWCFSISIYVCLSWVCRLRAVYGYVACSYRATRDECHRKLFAKHMAHKCNCDTFFGQSKLATLTFAHIQNASALSVLWLFS